MARLIIKEGALKGLEFELESDETSIGRDASNTIRIPKGQVSRHHSLIKKDGNDFVITDLGSLNGTIVNGKNLKKTTLKDHDTIKIGETVLEFIDKTYKSQSTTASATFDTNLDGSRIAATVDTQYVELLQKDTGRHTPEQLQQDRKNLIAIYEIFKAAGESSNPNDLFELIVDTIEPILEADRIYFILNDADHSVWFKSKNKINKKMYDLPYSSQVVSHVYDNKLAVLVENPENDARFAQAQSLINNEVNSVICAPILFNDEVRGCIYADRLGSSMNFTKDELEFLTAVASQASICLSQIETNQNLQNENKRLHNAINAGSQMIGSSDQIAQIYNVISRVSQVDSPVLILGESGTGKELVASALHNQSPRSHHPFESVNCAALTETLIESELFGHVKGAFTGALQDRSGRFELANNGTLFLDEIGELPESSQSKLLRALEQGTIRRVGDEKDIKVNVRIIAATNRNLDQLSAEGKFRQDLFYRLNVLRIQLPALRERPSDIKELIEHFLKHFCTKCARENLTIDKDAMEILVDYQWPGNIRELKNIIERMVVMSQGPKITKSDIPYEINNFAQPQTQTNLNTQLVSLSEIEKNHIIKILEHTQGNKKEAAEILQIDRSTLYSKIKTYNI